MEYVSIRTTTIRGDQKISFNAYMKLDGKMVLFLRKGDSFEGPRLTRLIDRKLKKMYILNEEEPLYLDYLKSNLDRAYDMESNLDLTTRAEIISGSQQNNVESVFEDIGNAEVYAKTKNEALQFVNVIQNSFDTSVALLNMENTESNLAQHGVAVATLSVLLAQRLGMSDKSQITLLTTGALLHDYGHSLNPIDLQRPVKEMSPEDQLLWKSHPIAGSKTIANTKHFDPNVVNIIGQHEEHIDGSGPLSLRESKIDPFAVLVGTANVVDRLLSFEGVSRADVIKTLKRDYSKKRPTNHIQAMSDIIKEI